MQVFALTAPYSTTAPSPPATGPPCPYPAYDRPTAHAFVAAHGLAVRAVGVVVEDAAAAFAAAVAGGAVGACPPTPSPCGTQTTAAVELYGNVLLRFVSGDTASAPFLAGYVPEPDAPAAATGEGTLGLRRLDHAVGNVPHLLSAANYVMAATGFHEFAEFTADDVGTAESGLNSVVLANNDETVLLPINEPTHGTKRKSQIQTFLEHHGGAGLQHLALMTDDAIATLRALRDRGDFDLMPPAPPAYYDRLPGRVGDVLSAAQMDACRELGLLVDRDDQAWSFFLQSFLVVLLIREVLRAAASWPPACSPARPHATLPAHPPRP